MGFKSPNLFVFNLCIFFFTKPEYFISKVPSSFQVIHIERPLRCQGWCCFCCLQTVEVQSPPGSVVGYIKQDCTFVYPWFTVENAEGEVVLKIKGPCWTCKWCDVEFQVGHTVYSDLHRDGCIYMHINCTKCIYVHAHVYMYICMC